MVNELTDVLKMSIDENLVETIVTDCHPLSLVEKTGFMPKNCNLYVSFLAEKH